MSSTHCTNFFHQWERLQSNSNIYLTNTYLGFYIQDQIWITPVSIEWMRNIYVVSPLFTFKKVGQNNQEMLSLFSPVCWQCEFLFTIYYDAGYIYLHAALILWGNSHSSANNWYLKIENQRYFLCPLALRWFALFITYNSTWADHTHARYSCRRSRRAGSEFPCAISICHGTPYDNTVAFWWVTVNIVSRSSVALAKPSRRQLVYSVHSEHWSIVHVCVACPL